MFVQVIISRKRAAVSGMWKQMARLDSVVCFVGVNCYCCTRNPPVLDLTGLRDLLR